MAKIFTVQMLPAAQGDGTLIEYGDARAPHRVVIDGGPAHTYRPLFERLQGLPPRRRHVELLVVTHVDIDHAEGIIRLLQEDELGLSYGDVWFNGWQQLADSAGRAALQGEYVDALVADRRLPSNRAFGGAPVVAPDAGPLPRVTLPGGLTLTLLSPLLSGLWDLIPVWEDTLRQHGVEPGDHAAALAQLAAETRYRPLAGGQEAAPAAPGDPEGAAAFGTDDSAANGSSIALLAEFAGRRCLLPGDAHAPVLAAALDRLRAEAGLPAGGRVPVDAFKLSHHGSRGSISPALVGLLDSRRYLVSTSGAKYAHPHADAIDLVLGAHAGPPAELVFNYRSATTTPWLDPARQAQRGYRATLATGPVDLLAP